MGRHDDLVVELSRLCRRGLDPHPRLEQVVPQLQSRVGGQVGQARLDVVAYHGARRFLIDVTVVSLLAGSDDFVTACSRRDGHAARRAAVGKRLKYGSPDLLPFAVETGGRLGTEARAFLHLLAQQAEDPQRELAYLYRAVSVMLQKGVARRLL